MQDYKQLYADKLRELSGALSTDDRAQAVRELNICRQTLSAYLRGEVRKISLAQMIVEYFAPIVREKVTKLKEVHA